MRNMVCSLVAFCFMATVAYCEVVSKNIDQKPIPYELKIAQYADTYGKTPQYVYLFGDVAYKSLDGVKKFISIIPRGSTIEWRPTCIGPSPLLESQENELKVLCEARGVKFIHVPSG